MENEIFNFWKKIILANNILLINHIRMDPDAFWSLSAFYWVLKKLWKNVNAINDELAPKDFCFLNFTNIFETDIDIKKFSPDLIISFDAASSDQLWKIYKNNKEVFDKNDFYVIDHHITNPWFWKYNIINTKASSTCEIVFYIIEKLNLTKYIDEKIATNLYTWIITDTNIFYNSNTTSETLKTASKLIELWADFRSPVFEFYKKRSFNKVKLRWEIMKGLKSINNWKIIYWLVKEEYFIKTNTTEKDVSGLINEFLSNIEWMEVCFLIYKIENWEIKASFRSKENFNVWEFCKRFWWWWHKNAAWFSLNWEKNSLESVEKIIISELEKK